MFVGIPAAQHAIDCSHGMVNELYGVCLPVVENTLIDCGWTNKDVNDYFGTINMDPICHIWLGVRSLVMDSHDPLTMQ